MEILFIIYILSVVLMFSLFFYDHVIRKNSDTTISDIIKAFIITIVPGVNTAMMILIICVLIDDSNILDHVVIKAKTK